MGGQVRPRWEGELGGTQDKEPCDIARQGDSRSEGPRCRAAEAGAGGAGNRRGRGGRDQGARTSRAVGDLGLSFVGSCKSSKGSVQTRERIRLTFLKNRSSRYARNRLPEWGRRGGRSSEAC